jgi:hypothetical protein
MILLQTLLVFGAALLWKLGHQTLERGEVGVIGEEISLTLLFAVWQ